MLGSQFRLQHADMAGKPIAVGNVIVYATSTNSSGRMKCGIVAELQWRSVERWTGGASAAAGGDGHYESCQQPKLSVITAENGINWTARHSGLSTSLESDWHLQKLGVPVMLDRFDEILVVSDDALPQRVVQMLRNALAARDTQHAR